METTVCLSSADGERVPGVSTLLLLVPGKHPGGRVWNGGGLPAGTARHAAGKHSPVHTSETRLTNAHTPRATLHSWRLTRENKGARTGRQVWDLPSSHHQRHENET